MNYTVAEGFRPPTISRQTLIATGTFANRYGGGRRTGDKAVDRSFVIPLHVLGASDGEARAALRQLQDFCDRLIAGGEPFYFAWRDHDNFPFEPSFGQLNAYLRYELLNAEVHLSEKYGGDRF